MIQICRAEDGEVFQVCPSWITITDEHSADPGERRRMQLFGKLKGKLPRHVTPLLSWPRAKPHPFIRLGSLESFLHKEIGIEESAALAYLSDGRRLRTDNVRDLAGAQDQVRASPLPSALLSPCIFAYPPCV